MSASELPENCIKYCPVVNGCDDVEEYRLVPTRNCRGPALGEGDIKQKIELRRDGTALVIPPHLLSIEKLPDSGVRVENSHGSAIGYLVCQNVGFNASIDKLIEQAG